MNENKEAVQARTFDGGVTPEQVEAWKNKYRKVSRVDIVDEGETKAMREFRNGLFAFHVQIII